MALMHSASQWLRLPSQQLFNWVPSAGDYDLLSMLSATYPSDMGINTHAQAGPSELYKVSPSRANTMLMTCQSEDTRLWTGIARTTQVM